MAVDIIEKENVIEYSNRAIDKTKKVIANLKNKKN